MFCIDSFNIGGTELNAVRTAERLDRSRFDLSVVCLRPEGPLKERLEAAGVPIIPFPISRLYDAATFLQGWRLLRFLRQSRTDIFHAHDIYSNIFGVPWARAAGVRVIASRRWWMEANRPSQLLVNRQTFRLAHRVLGNSPGVGSLLRSREGVAAERIVIVPNFLDEAAFDPPSAEARSNLRAELGISHDRRIIGMVANLLPVKDHDSLLRAVALLRPRWPDLALILVGEGVCRDPLTRLARDLAVDDLVHFAGRRPHHPNLHHLFEISILSSRSEGLSNSILEAMAAGNPVVATDVGAVSDAVVDGETGILVPAGEPERLAASLERLLADPRLAVRMGMAGRERARSRFSADAAISKLEGVYVELAREAGLPSRGVGENNHSRTDA